MMSTRFLLILTLIAIAPAFFPGLPPKGIAPRSGRRAEG